MRLKRTSNSELLDLSASSPIGQGGEARVYSVPGNNRLVAKLYHRPTPAHARKLRVMVSNPPLDPEKARGEVSIAWPLDLLKTTDSIGQTAGYLMHRVQDRFPIMDFYNPATRRGKCALFNYQYLLRTARNLASTFAAIHAKGYVIGDVNESNVLVSQTTLVTLVDTDSFQVKDPKNGDVFRCMVGKPEFTPPELQDKSFPQIDRLPEHDRFGLAVLIFLLLMEGTHPFDGVFSGYDNPPLREQRIQAGHFPYGNKKCPYVPKPTAPNFAMLHPTLRQLFLRCFEDGHSNPKVRPDALTWQRALLEAEKSLIQCAQNNQHRYFDHLTACPWCERTQLLGGRDPFPSRKSVKEQSYQTQPLRSKTRVSSQSPMGASGPVVIITTVPANQMTSPAVAPVQTLPLYNFPLIPTSERINFVTSFVFMQGLAAMLAFFVNAFTVPLTAGLLIDNDPFRYNLYSSLVSGGAFGFVMGYFQKQALGRGSLKPSGWIRASMLGAFLGFLLQKSTGASPEMAVGTGIVIAICQCAALAKYIDGAWTWAFTGAIGSLLADYAGHSFLKGQYVPFIPFIDSVGGGLFSAIALSISRRKLNP